MNKTTISLIGVALGIIIGWFLRDIEPINGDKFGTGYNANTINGLYVYATTTGTSAGAGPCSGDCPVLLLSPSQYGSYARFENTGAAPVFLHPTSSPLDITEKGAARTATTSLPHADGIRGIRLEALGAANEENVFELDLNKFISAYWYATTTAGTANIINVQYR